MYKMIFFFTLIKYSFIPVSLAERVFSLNISALKRVYLSILYNDFYLFSHSYGNHLITTNIGVTAGIRHRYYTIYIELIYTVCSTYIYIINYKHEHVTKLFTNFASRIIISHGRTQEYSKDICACCTGPRTSTILKGQSRMSCAARNARWICL